MKDVVVFDGIITIYLKSMNTAGC